jgi:SAM-dependent methyltransferase
MPTFETDPELSDLCTVCGGKTWALVRSGTDLYRPGNAEAFNLSKCCSCGLVRQRPIPSKQQLDAAYSISRDYLCYRPAWKEHGWPLWKILRLWTTSQRVRRLRRYSPGHRLLETGCGAGDFMVAATRAGWNVAAVEYNTEMVEAIRGHHGFDVRPGELRRGLWESGQFDVVTLWNVLEHVRGPVEELRLAADYLREGGHVLMSIPTRQAAEDGKWFGKYWALLDLPRHIHFFDRATLSTVCEQAGLELHTYKTPFAQSAWCYYMSSWNWAARAGAGFLRWLRFACAAAVVTILLPCIAIKSAIKEGVEAFAIAEKPLYPSQAGLVRSQASSREVQQPQVR